MKIVQVIDSLKVGGAQKLVVVFSRKMLEKNHQVKIISLSNPDLDSPVFQELKALDVSMVHMPLRSIADIKRIGGIAREIRNYQTDIVHTQLNYANIYGTLAARRSGIPSVASLHNASVHLYNYRPYRIWLETQVLERYSRRIIACGYTVARVQQHRFKSKELDVIPNPVPAFPEISDSQLKAIKQEMLPGGKGFLIISVGRLIPEKGYSDLIQAFALARQQFRKPVKFLIVGKGYLHDDLQKEINQTGLQADILLAGERSDVPALLGASDLYISGSHYEGQSLAVLEAMLSGLPIVATDVGDNRQIIAKECGIVLPSGRVDLLAAEMVRLAQHPAERKKLGTNASMCVREKYSPAGWIDRLLDLYTEVLHG